MSNPKQEKVNIPLLSGALGLLSAISTAALVSVYILTLEPIKEQKLKATNSALMKVLPVFDNTPGEEKIIIGTNSSGVQIVDLYSNLISNGGLAELSSLISIYPAKKDGKIIGLAGEGKSPLGFGGDVKAMVGLNPDGSIILGIVTGHQETPGLGTAITDRVRTKTILDILGMGKEIDETILPGNKTLDQFQGRVANVIPWGVKKDGGDIDFVSGATVSSRAVTDVFYKIASAYTFNKEKILALSAK